MSRRRATVVELVGPAGAGKTTLAERLDSAPSGRCRHLSLWGLPRWTLLTSALALVPAVVAAAARRRPFAASELAQMIRVDALRRVVAREARRRGVVVLDEGPVFALSWLDVNFRRNGARTFAAWRHRMIRAWGPLLGAIVCVDAADATLAQRIRTRAKPHQVKHRPVREIYEFTAEFRHAFPPVIAEMQAAGTRHLTRLNTDGDSLDHSSNRLVALAAEWVNGH